MQYSSSVLLLAFSATNVLAHGVITEIQGANQVTMPGLSVIDGTPRDCPTPRCGAEADTSIIRANSASPLGKSQGGGPVSAAPMIAMFMDPTGANNTAAKAAREIHYAKRAVFERAISERAAGGGVPTPKGTVETGVKAATGMGMQSGLPTAADDGTIAMTFHQVNQDGAGPLTAMIDPTSGGTTASAFQKAEVTQNVPGLGIGGLSAAQTMDFPVKVQMPPGMTCSGVVGDVQNVCVVMAKNAALAGPFGGSALFTQTAAAKKRAIEYNLSKRRFARAIVDSNNMDMP